MNSDFFNENAQGDLLGPAVSKSGSKGSRLEMEKHFKQLPVSIRAELKSGKLRLADTVVYAIRAVSSKTVKMFETQDTKEIGLRNISNGKLPKNQALLVSGIFMLAGKVNALVPGSPTPDEIKSTAFGSLSALNLAALANGEFSLKANKVQLVPETSMRIFITDNDHMSALGYYKLHNPRLIQDDVLIEATIELGTTMAIPIDTYLFIGLYGTTTTP